MTFKRAIEVAEKCFLILIAAFTVAATAQEVTTQVVKRRVELKDLPLMFIYAEVLTMVGAFYAGQRILITLPLFIAMNALSRLIILQGKVANPVTLLYERSAIAFIARACRIISRMRAE